MVGRQFLDLYVEVRILGGQPFFYCAFPVTFLWKRIIRTMETSPATPQIWMIAFGIGMTIFFFFSWNPIAKRLKKFEPDPEKGLKKALLVTLVVYVIAVFIMIIAMMALVFGAIS